MQLNVMRELFTVKFFLILRCVGYVLLGKLPTYYDYCLSLCASVTSINITYITGIFQVSSILVFRSSVKLMQTTAASSCEWKLHQ